MPRTSNWYHTYTKPLSANMSYTGRKVMTAAYRKYAIKLQRTLPDLLVPDDLMEIRIVVYYSNKASDIDNCIKPFIDCLQKRYGFNDNRVYRLQVTKVIVKRGEDNIAFQFLPFTPSGALTYGNEEEAY